MFATALSDLGLLGMFLAGLLAGSVLPFPSEGVLVALIGGGWSPVAVVGVASLGNVLGAVTVYLVGRAIARGGRLGDRLRRRWDKEPGELERARARAERYGAPALLLAWVPVVGDVFVLGAGLIGVRAVWFLPLVTAGKVARYAAVAYALTSA